MKLGVILKLGFKLEKTKEERGSKRGSLSEDG
jgi:hypothetical protein